MKNERSVTIPDDWRYLRDALLQRSKIVHVELCTSIKEDLIHTARVTTTATSPRTGRRYLIPSWGTHPSIPIAMRKALFEAVERSVGLTALVQANRRRSPPLRWATESWTVHRGTDGELGEDAEGNTNGQSAPLPIQLVDTPIHLTQGRPADATTSAGLASRETFEDAAWAALLEICERSAFVTWWRGAGTVASLTPIRYALVGRLCTDPALTPYEICIYKIPCNLPISVIWACGWSDVTWPHFCSGLACSENDVSAVSHAVHELKQCIVVARRSRMPDYGSQGSWQYASLRGAHQLRRVVESRLCEDQPVPDASLSEDLMRELRASGARVFAWQLSPLAIERAGAFVARVSISRWPDDPLARGAAESDMPVPLF